MWDITWCNEVHNILRWYFLVLEKIREYRKIIPVCKYNLLYGSNIFNMKHGLNSVIYSYEYNGYTVPR